MGETPQVGDMVLYQAAATEGAINGSRLHPAVVTRVFGRDMVNLRVLTDGAGVEWKTHVLRDGFADELAACWRARD